MGSEMNIGYLIASLIAVGLFAPLSNAQELKLSLPLECVLGESCIIQQYVDHDPSKGAQDYTCGAASYDGHTGTDFRVLDYFRKPQGVAVLAAASGVVLRRRDGMKDKRLETPADRAAIKGKECGNAVLLDHGQGWETLYCHMKQGSIQVTVGARVEQGTRLGLVGLSGETEFPHLHITVNKDEQVIDPFQAQKGTKCGDQAGISLWDASLPVDIRYKPTQVSEVGFASGAVKYRLAKDGEYADTSSLSSDKPLVAYGLAVNLRQGDQIRVSLGGAKGEIVHSLSAPLVKNKAQRLIFAGKKPPVGGWPKGAYVSQLSVLRAGQEISVKTLLFNMK